MELASPSPEEPVTQIEADVPDALPVEPLALQADAPNLDLDLHAYERPLAVTPFWDSRIGSWLAGYTHAVQAVVHDSRLGKWVRADVGVRTLQGLGKNSPATEQVARRITRLHTRQLLEFFFDLRFPPPGAPAPQMPSWL